MSLADVGGAGGARGVLEALRRCCATGEPEKQRALGRPPHAAVSVSGGEGGRGGGGRTGWPRGSGGAGLGLHVGPGDTRGGAHRALQIMSTASVGVLERRESPPVSSGAGDDGDTKPSTRQPHPQTRARASLAFNDAVVEVEEAGRSHKKVCLDDAGPPLRRDGWTTGRSSGVVCSSCFYSVVVLCLFWNCGVAKCATSTPNPSSWDE